ncbi:MAG: GDP-L-fucose synthase [Verrucomicrobia bacterium]|nr:GDP-L-fucose synthase [Verrucomicrobiota bacterium]
MTYRSIFVAGHRGLVGSAVVRNLRANGYANLILRSRDELDLRNSQAVHDFFALEKPEVVIDAAARVGGIKANVDFPAEFILENLQIQNNVISASFESGVEKFVFLGSSCIYPKFAPQPISEDALLSGVLESTNEPYAIAKIAGIKLCQAYAREYGKNFISIMPSNLYGPGDDFDFDKSHVVPALIRKVHQAKVKGEDQILVWGSGSPRRELLHVDDLADALRFLLENYHSPDIINAGYGEDITIRELVAIISEIIGCKARLIFDHTKPDGTPRKLLDSSRLRNLGWRPRLTLHEGVRQTYDWFLRTSYADVVL